MAHIYIYIYIYTQHFFFFKGIKFPPGLNTTSIFADVTIIDTIYNSYAGSQAQFQIVPISTSGKLDPLLLCSSALKQKNIVIETCCPKFYPAYARWTLS